MQKQISEIRVTPIKPKADGLVGFASLVFEDSFYLGSIGIFTRPRGNYRLAYPTKKNSNGSLNIFHPINKSISKQIEEAVVNKLEEVKGKEML